MRFISASNYDFGVSWIHHPTRIGSLRQAQLPWISPRINMPQLDAAKALLSEAYLSCINQVCNFSDDLLYCAVHTSTQAGPWDAPWGRKPSMITNIEQALLAGLIPEDDQKFWARVVSLRDSLDHFKPDEVVRHIKKVEEVLFNRGGRPQYFTASVDDHLSGSPNRLDNDVLQGMLFHGEFLALTARFFFMESSIRLKEVVGRTNWKEDQRWMAQRLEYQETFQFDWSSDRLQESARKYLKQFDEMP